MAMFVVGEFDSIGTPSFELKFAKNQAKLPDGDAHAKYPRVVKEIGRDYPKNEQGRERAEKIVSALQVLCDIDFVEDEGCAYMCEALDFAFEMGRHHERRLNERRKSSPTGAMTLLLRFS